ncbi:nicotinate phosphoribosyltransferase, partial [Xanthomonas perforans]|nr:nicotinate phosphoribosyltransferase [Xanthomonas perforans]
MIIHSLLDTDLYKFTMMQAVLHQHPAAQVDYRFKCRTPGVDLAQFVDEISREIDALCRLRLREDEVDYLRSLRFIKPDFADFLALFHLDRKYLSLTASATHPGEIELTIRGPWLHTILFEVPLLAIINEVWFRNTSEPDFEEGRSRLREKVASLRSMPAGCRIADYGT